MGKRMIAADKMNFTIGNVVKRIYHIYREECNNEKIDLASNTPLDNISNIQ